MEQEEITLRVVVRAEDPHRDRPCYNAGEAKAYLAERLLSLESEGNQLVLSVDEWTQMNPPPTTGHAAMYAEQAPGA